MLLDGASDQHDRASTAMANIIVPRNARTVNTETEPDFFNGYVYVSRFNRIWHEDHGFMDKVKFDFTLADYTFRYDPDGPDTKSAWVAFMQNRFWKFANADGLDVTSSKSYEGETANGKLFVSKEHFAQVVR